MAPNESSTEGSSTRQAVSPKAPASASWPSPSMNRRRQSRGLAGVEEPGRSWGRTRERQKCKVPSGRRRGAGSTARESWGDASLQASSCLGWFLWGGEFPVKRNVFLPPNFLPRLHLQCLGYFFISAGGKKNIQGFSGFIFEDTDLSVIPCIFSDVNIFWHSR